MRPTYPWPVASLSRFSALTRAWFEGAFAEPTPAQELGWEAISEGQNTLILAPTGSGKTLAAFLWVIDRLLEQAEQPPEKERCRVLYVSPLKALTYDVDRNLRAPLAGIALQAERAGKEVPSLRTATRTGDTPAADRRDIVRHPPDILITTPESLYLMLTSGAREILRSVEYVVVDEIHAVAGTKRGAHLALSLERLERLTARPPQRIGLSATQRPLDEIARFLGARARPPRLGGTRAAPRDRGRTEGRQVARPRGHVVARARHRHGCHRPRRAGGVPVLGRQRSPAHRPGRPSGGRAVARPHLPQVP